MNALRLIIFSAICLTSQHGFCGSKTNINKVTDLFDSNIENKDALFEDIKHQREEMARQITSKENFDFIEGMAGSDSKTQELNAISDTSLENAGRAKRASEEYRFYDENELEPDYTKPGNILHKEDMDDLAKGTSSIIWDLMSKLKEIDIDCKTEKGPVQKDPVYYIDIKREEQKQTDYDQFFCEELKNQYSCKDVLSVRCADVGFVAAGLGNVSGNMTHTNAGGVLTIGVNQERYFYNNWGSQQDFTFGFDVVNAAGINSFKLLQVDWADYVLITLNGHIIFQAPGVNGVLEMSTHPDHYRRADNGERFYGVNIGAGDFVSANTRRYHTSSPHIEVRQFLQNGRNTLNIRLVYGNGGKIWTQFYYTEKVCRSWQETWDEQCTFN